MGELVYEQIYVYFVTASDARLATECPFVVAGFLAPDARSGGGPATRTLAQFFSPADAGAWGRALADATGTRYHVMPSAQLHGVR